MAAVKPDLIPQHYETQSYIHKLKYFININALKNLILCWNQVPLCIWQIFTEHHYVPGIVLWKLLGSSNKINQSLCPHGDYILMGGDNTINKLINMSYDTQCKGEKVEKEWKEILDGEVEFNLLWSADASLRR